MLKAAATLSQKLLDPIVTNDAYSGRILLVVQQVMSCFQASQLFMQPRVALTGWEGRLATAH